MQRFSGQHSKPNRSPAQRVRFGEEEQRHERALTFEKSRSKRYRACSDVSYDVTYDTSNSARHGFWKSPFCHAARYLCTSFPFVLGCNFLLHQFPGFLVNDCGMEIFNIVLPNSSIVFHRFMVQEIWCISFLKQGIAHIFLVCENTIRPITEDDKKTYWDR